MKGESLGSGLLLRRNKATREGGGMLRLGAEQEKRHQRNSNKNGEKIQTSEKIGPPEGDEASARGGR